MRGTELREGRHIRLEGDKKVLQDIKAHEGSMVELTGLLKRSDVEEAGIGLARGIDAVIERIVPEQGAALTAARAD